MNHEMLKRKVYDKQARDPRKLIPTFLFGYNTILNVVMHGQHVYIKIGVLFVLWPPHLNPPQLYDSSL
jgi:hypothetical protein